MRGALRTRREGGGAGEEAGEGRVPLVREERLRILAGISGEGRWKREKNELEEGREEKNPTGGNW